jgi:hypothetical protein
MRTTCSCHENQLHEVKKHFQQDSNVTHKFEKNHGPEDLESIPNVLILINQIGAKLDALKQREKVMLKLMKLQQRKVSSKQPSTLGSVRHHPYHKPFHPNPWPQMSALCHTNDTRDPKLRS